MTFKDRLFNMDQWMDIVHLAQWKFHTQKMTTKQSIQTSINN